MSVTVATATASDAAACHDFLSRHGAFPGHVDPRWATILASHYAMQATTLLARTSEGVISGLLFCYHRNGDGHTLYSPPYGLIAGDPAAAAALQRSASEIAKAAGLGRTIITSGTTDLAGPHHRWSRQSITLALPRLADDEAVLAWLPQKTRNMVRKARRTGLKISDTPQHLPDFYRVYRNRLAAKGLTLKPLGFFADMAAAFQDECLLLTALEDDAVVGAMLFQVSGTSAAYLYNAATERGLQAGCNNLLMAEAARNLSARGITRLDLGESMPGSGVFDFKTKGCGGQAEVVQYYDLMRLAGTQPPRLAVGLAERAYGYAVSRCAFLPAALREVLLLKASGYGRVL